MHLDRRRLRWPAIGLATLAVFGTGTAYAVTGSESEPHYRTVAATISDVEETLSTTGSVDAAKRADLGFGTDGTVAELLVAVGDTVKAGQVIAELDTADLDAALTQAKAEYAHAVAQLASDEDAQASAVSDSQSDDQSAAPSSPSTPSNDGSSSAATAALLKALKKAQGEVVLAQSHASQVIGAAKQALVAQQQACAAATSAATSTPSPSTTSTDAPSADDTSSSCDVALAAVQQAQDVVSQAQDDLATALDALAKVLGQALGSVQGQANARTAASDGTSAASSDQQSSTPSNGGAGQTVTAAQLASDQAKIEDAQASVVAAQQNLAQARLRSTRSGQVVALDTEVGDQVTAGGTVATVVGGTSVTVTTTVTEAQVGSVKVGQAVRVSVPGISNKTSGTVSAIGLVADSSTGTVSYPVTVTVETPTISLPTGSRASMQIVLETAKDVVTVPTSAVTRSGSGSAATVSTWNGSTLTRKTVQLGAIGPRQVAISSGLSAGTRVVLADLDQAITGAATSVNDRGSIRFPGGATFRAPAGGNGGPVTFSRGG